VTFESVELRTCSICIICCFSKCHLLSRLLVHCDEARSLRFTALQLYFEFCAEVRPRERHISAVC